MSSPPREWSLEPRLPYVFDPSLLEMTPLKISSPAPDSPEYTCQGSEESSFLRGAPPLYPSATRLEGRSPMKLRIKLKPRSLGELSQSRPETTTLCVIDAASTPGPLPGREDIVPLEP
ncbi:hypothetical protein Dimus_001040 [Dionaea muscipula]